MYELNCAGIIPGCGRVIRADDKSEVFARAVTQARRMGYKRIPTQMLDRFREDMIEIHDKPMRAAG
ncbi:DUF1059 domain-containing protein [Fulvimarina endophytica]|uniref:DUF1059 domain-containing protein n=1 Tax=Fulvimarina endophytica TaxID=2293836 RepID=A0A371XAN7_9HYPH|nr:DUF1059 domain-containing protein [Fulvimarina endophytica]RFC66252.1 DUF1059 domain-containing protein [Fulvimarina endophytica]